MSKYGDVSSWGLAADGFCSIASANPSLFCPNKGTGGLYRFRFLVQLLFTFQVFVTLLFQLFKL